MAYKSVVKISRQQVELLYSIFLILLIPIILAFNTVWLTSQIKSNFEIELQRKANLANEIFSEAALNLINDKVEVQAFVNRVAKRSSEVKLVTVLVPDEFNNFRVIASSEEDLIGDQTQDAQDFLVWSKQQSIAAAVRDVNSDRFWKVTTPIFNELNKPVGLISMNVSSADIDALLEASFRQAGIILIASILAIMLLLVNHFRFVGYAILLKKLEEVDRLKNDLLSVATHELKTPMAVIKGYISMILEGIGGKVDDKAKVTLRKVFDQTERLNRLVTDLLDVSRIEQGRTKYELSSIDLTLIIKKVIEELTLKANEKKIKLLYEPSGKVPKVKLDADRAHEIFTNLIDNAIKYSEKGQVEITHDVSNDKIATRVKDSGIGMNKSDQEKLFQRFYRIKTDKTQNISGAGLGLWIIKQYIERMNGTISLDSMEGVGTTFTITFHSTNEKLNSEEADSNEPKNDAQKSSQR